MKYKLWIGAVMTVLCMMGMSTMMRAETTSLLTEPMLQNPTEDSVHVVWFTDSDTKNNLIVYGEQADQIVQADSYKLSRMRTFAGKKVNVWRHEGIVKGLPQYHGTINERVLYYVESDGIRSEQYYLQAKAQNGTKLNILLTSDGQLKDMVAANLQMAEQTVGHIDAVFYAGDLVNIPDQADEWFDFGNVNTFFSLMQGNGKKKLNGVTYQGASLLQEAPMYAAVGNHEFMGRYSNAYDIGIQFNDVMPDDFNTISYEELFSMPVSRPGGELYYAETVGDVRLIVLNVARMWRNQVIGEKSDYSEDVRSLGNPLMTSGGAIIYEPIKKGSAQYQWLEQELKSEAFCQAKYKVVMFHHQVHGLGLNVVPPYTDPVKKEIRDAGGSLQQILYEYPIENDYLLRDLEPLLEQAGVDLVFNGHSHVWNRFRTKQGMNYLESSNVGNNYGAYFDGRKRDEMVPSDMKYFDAEDYSLSGDPGGLKPISPLFMDKKVCYIASNEVTVFSILNTQTGIVSSYAYDITKPEDGVKKIDYFLIKRSND